MKMNRLRIAIFHLGFFYSGGGEKLVLEEIRGLRALGHHVVCYAPYVDKMECYPDIPEMQEIQPLIPPPPKWLPMKDALWVTISCLVIPFTAWRFRSFDVFVGANQPGPWFAWVLSKILRKPYVIYLAQPLRLIHPRKVDLENGMQIREGDHKFIKFLTRFAGWCIGWADRTSVSDAAIMLANGDYVSYWLSKIYKRGNWVCSAGCHPINENELNYSAKWEGSLKVNGSVLHKPFVLLTNRHSPQKRFEYALWAMKHIYRKAQNLYLVITGQETSYTDDLRYLVKGLGLEGRVHFLGLVNEQDLTRLYREAALYIYPSPEEDFGMGIIEAMAAGTPVVAWNNGGPTGIVLDDETGFLVEPYVTEKFAGKMLELISDHALVEKMGRASHKRVKEKFSFERHNQILEAALITAVKDHMKEISGNKSKHDDKTQPKSMDSFGEPGFILVRKYNDEGSQDSQGILTALGSEEQVDNVNSSTKFK
jgi:glycosyltransferase involved in cell wall biosynthesis